MKSYFTNYGFEVTELKAKENVCSICDSGESEFPVSVLMSDNHLVLVDSIMDIMKLQAQTLDT